MMPQGVPNAAASFEVIVQVFGGTRARTPLPRRVDRRALAALGGKPVWLVLALAFELDRAVRWLAHSWMQADVAHEHLGPDEDLLQLVRRPRRLT